ncbi:uncharacterized protein BO80DRAFT_194322 [Aspergillus ibericus CBS 121593]|uniref:C2H2-type domain-containing protein n=1 Tax=Aspergillus ibericus CBS 121593 TaxID=1448316 RepID=A0A395GPG0_9EURO|nr:hypothetical protein BO80DRAFT_194322 [Aspergillus ibericus CBS 121593]RAK97359.1 hypothetical protein BO80DRAFT_194322 [Aspergillus ibericus CBS 121593]
MAREFLYPHSRGIKPRSAGGGSVSTELGPSYQFSAARQPVGTSQARRQSLMYQRMVPADPYFNTNVFGGNSHQHDASYGMVERGHNTIAAHSPSAYDGSFFETHPSSFFQESQSLDPESISIAEFLPPSSTNPVYNSRDPQIDTKETQPRLRCEWKDCTYKNGFNRPADLLRHVKTMHVTPQSFKCDFPGCKRTFSRKDNLRGHQLHVHHRMERP